MQTFPQYSEMFSGGTWAVLTSPGSEIYNSLWAPLLLGEIAVNGALVLAWLFMAFLFFSKKSTFPRWYVGMLVFTLSFIVADALAVKHLLSDEPLLDPDMTREFSRALVATCIWVPYMLMPKRVKATFVK